METEEFQIGSRLKKLRKESGLSMAELSAKSGVSVGLISQIERDIVVPSVVNLYRIAHAMNSDINYFFEDKQSDNLRIIRRGKHKVITADHGNSEYELLSPYKGGRLMDLLRITLKGGELYERETITHAGEECGYVLQGTLTVLLDGNEYRLGVGDSIYFSSVLPHKYINDEAEDCVSIWATTPVFF